MRLIRFVILEILALKEGGCSQKVIGLDRILEHLIFAIKAEEKPENLLSDTISASFQIINFDFHKTAREKKGYEKCPAAQFSIYE